MRTNKKNSTGESLRSGTSGLVEYMNSETESRIAEINRAADEDIRRIEETVRAEILQFISEQEKESNRHIENERFKIQNRLFIEKKKLVLHVMDSFMEKITAEAVDSLPGNDGYYDFLVRIILEPFKDMKGPGVTVKVSERDLAYSGMILDSIRESGFPFKTEIKKDERIKAGGAVIIDGESGVVFNNSIERIVYRKTDVIRKEIFTLLEEYGREKIDG